MFSPQGFREKLIGDQRARLNLYREVFYPVMAIVSPVTPAPFDQRRPTGKDAPIAPGLGFAVVIERAQVEGAKRGWPEPVGAVFYNQSYGIYTARFFQPGASMARRASAR